MKLAPAILAALVFAAPAGAQGVSLFAFGGAKGIHVLSDKSIPVRVTGQLTVAFHGDPGTGCSVYGLCAYSGTISWQPGPSGQLNLVSYRLHRHRGYSASLFLIGALGGPGGLGGGSVTVAEVRRAGALGQTGTCADASQSAPGSSGLAVRGDTVSLRLTDASTSLLGTRCAGPRAADLAQALPVRRLSIRALDHGTATANFSTAQSFAAHGFAGTVRSSVVLRFGRPQLQRSSQSRPGPTPSVVRTRLVTVDLRLSRLSGGVLAKLAGARDPDECTPLDSCGATGMVTLQPRAFDATGQLIAFGSAQRPYRDFLAALGLSRTGRRRGIQVLGSVDWQDRGTVSEAFDQGFSCRDSGRLTTGDVQLAVGGGRVVASYNGQAQGADLLRTRCPGPEAGSADLASGGLPLSALARHTLTIPLTTGSTLTDDGYSIRTTPRLTVTLERGRVTQQIARQPG